MTSIAFRNVELFDGLGGEPFITDVGVKAGRIDSIGQVSTCLLYTSPSPRDKRQSRMPSSA